MIVIGFSGKAEHGKTTAAQAYKKIINDSVPELKVEIIPLAKRMKEQAKMVGWDGQKDEKGRRLLQEISWPIKHYHGEDIYAKWCYEQALEQNLDILLIDDVRMFAEVCYFDNLFDIGEIDAFYLIRIDRPNYKSHLTEEQLKDISETQLDNYTFDIEISNTSSIDVLGENVRLGLLTADDNLKL